MTMPTQSELAAQSLALYRELRDHLRRMLTGISAAETGWILAMDERMTDLRQAIEQADATLMAWPLPEVAETGVARLFDERRQAMAEVLSLQKEVIVQAESVQSLLGHDLAAMRAGRQALRGYTPPPEDSPGGIISRQS